MFVKRLKDMLMVQKGVYKIGIWLVLRGQGGIDDLQDHPKDLFQNGHVRGHITTFLFVFFSKVVHCLQSSDVSVIPVHKTNFSWQETLLFNLISNMSCSCINSGIFSVYPFGIAINVCHFFHDYFST